MQTITTTQNFYAGGMSVQCTAFDSPYSNAAEVQVHHWSGVFDAEHYGWLLDGVVDASRLSSAALCDVTGIHLLNGAVFRFSEGDMPAGFAPCTIIAKSSQLMFWEGFACDARLRGVTIHVTESAWHADSGGGAATTLSKSVASQ